jgi:hypothetical protein
MSEAENELVANLGNLWLCGRSYLPSAAAYIANVNKVVADGSDDRSAFARTGVVPGSTGTVPGSPVTGTHSGVVFPHWDALRDELQRVLAVSADNMYATADALVDVANLYAEEECASEELLTKIQGFVESGDHIIDDPERRPEPQQPD